MVRSINEPKSSAPEQATAVSAPALPPLPPDSDLQAMTRAELDAMALGRGIDSSDAANKADVIALLKG